ncbi:MAG: DUF2125 domain-containing protein [Pseudomonadota bacterium]
MRLTALATTALVGLNVPAFSSDAAQTLWERWQDTARERGLELTAATTESDDDTLTLTDVSLGDAGDRATLETLYLTEGDSGAVDVTVPESVALTLEIVDDGEAANRAVFSLDSRGLVLTVADPTEPVRFDVSLADAVLELEEVEGPDAGEAPEIRVALNDGSGHLSTPADAPADMAITLAQATFDLAQIEPETGQPVTISNRAEQIDIKIAETSPPDSEGNADLSITASAGSLENSTESPVPSGRTVQVLVTQDAFNLAINATSERLGYDAQSQNSEVTVSGDAIPMGPIATRIAAAEVAFDLPAAPSETVQSAQGRLSLREVALDDGLWSALDPAGALPRDTLQVDASLSAEVLVTEEALAMTGTPSDIYPRYPRLVEIETLEIRYGQTSVSANGAMTLGPGNPDGPPVPPQPEGTITIDARGVLKLLQQLTAAGLIPPEQAMGAQMMIGMFAEQGEGDHLRSTIEAGGDGSLRVNGMQIR